MRTLGRGTGVAINKMAQILEASAGSLLGSSEGQRGLGIELRVLHAVGDCEGGAVSGAEVTAGKEGKVIFPFIKISEDAILDKSHWVIQGGAGWEPEIYRAVEEFLEDNLVPDIKMEYGIWATGFLDWVLGRGQGCLRISNMLDNDLHAFAVCVAVSSFGDSLLINWWLLTAPGFARWLMESAGYWLEGKPVPTPLVVSLDLRQQDTLLRPLTSATFSAAQSAVQEVMEALGHDVSDLHSASGFLK